ncbi:hypothetical protein V8J82_10220 [Gymnodinialimonas sp. 2305UL16-5]|uniref:hypothetical protein n=1 Tax=Gymnodinialimonas mytili TaxID=3126503 RepID=UPI0030A3810A
MQVNDVWRGCFAAYGGGVGILALIIALTSTAGAPDQVLSAFALSLLILGGYGLLLLGPAMLLAFVSYHMLRRRLRRAIWWQSVALVGGWSALVFVPLAGAAGGLILSAAFGALFGLPFWWGAVGWHWSVDLSAAGGDKST